MKLKYIKTLDVIGLEWPVRGVGTRLGIFPNSAPERGKKG